MHPWRGRPDRGRSQLHLETKLRGWISVVGRQKLEKHMREALDNMLAFDGHNGFIRAGGKEDAIQTLRRIAAGPNPPDPYVIEAYLTASGETSAKGVVRARNWYREILEGKNHRDYRGRAIH